MSGTTGNNLKEWEFATAEDNFGPDGTDRDPFLQLTVIPEPASLALLSLGSLVMLRRRGA